MKAAVRIVLENKQKKRSDRLEMIAKNSNYEEFLMEPESSKMFGFPDNSSLINPDVSLHD